MKWKWKRGCEAVQLEPRGVCGWRNCRGSDAQLGSGNEVPTGARRLEMPGASVEPGRRRRPFQYGYPRKRIGRRCLSTDSQGYGWRQARLRKGQGLQLGLFIRGQHHRIRLLFLI